MITFDQCIATVFGPSAVEVNKIEFEAQSRALSIVLTAIKAVPEEGPELLKSDLKAQFPFLQHIEVILNRQDTTPEVSVHWGSIVEVVCRQNPAAGRILKTSEVTFPENEIHIAFADTGLESTFHRYKVGTLIDTICRTNLSLTFPIVTRALKDVSEEIEAFSKQHSEAVESLAVQAAPAFNEAAVRADLKANGTNGGGGFKRRNGKMPETLEEGVYYRNAVRQEITPISHIDLEEIPYAIEAELISLEVREVKGGKYLVRMVVSDHENAIVCKQFMKKKAYAALAEQLSPGTWYKIQGIARYDTYDKERVMLFDAVSEGKSLSARDDAADEKRVELHMHTNMSEMDGVTSAKKLIETAVRWGHPAVAITDHGVLQAFPEAAEAAKDKIKVIYGVEGYLLDDVQPFILNADPRTFEDAYVVFDIETTGFSFSNDGITEIGAVKIKEGRIVDRFSSFVNPEQMIPSKVIELTGITQAMVDRAPLLDTVLPEFLAFIGDAAVVAHNAPFDVSFIRYACDQRGIFFEPPIVDTLSLSRLLLKKIKRHNLKAVTRHLKITLNDHHRAVADAEATAQVFLHLVRQLSEVGVDSLEALNAYAAAQKDLTIWNVYHVILLAQTQQGLKTLYKLVSQSHMETFHKKPLISKRALSEHRDGLLIGSACEAGELFRSMLRNEPEASVRERAAFYDYLEIQPLENNAFMLESGEVRSQNELKALNQRILALGDFFGKPVVATGDVHFLNPEDEAFRRILMAGRGYDDADNASPLYFRTTNEMLEAFDYLGARAMEVVVQNPVRIAESCEVVKPVPSGTFPPVIEGADEDFRRMCLEKAHSLYGNPLPDPVEQRLNRELNSIIGNGYAVMYIIAQKLVSKSMEEGYLVGSRGSVGSSFAATMSGITEVNPLSPHYLCPSCKYSEFLEEGAYDSGVDMPEKICPKCGTPLNREGFAIPFETFLGFDGDKEPDIDLNFAGVYQGTAHKYCEELFGAGKTFKAGTIGTIADKTAYGYVKKYFEEREQEVNRYEIERLAKGITGIKRTTGQHPGGIMVVPADRDIHEFTPIQFPANDGSTGIVTTHFDYHSISGRLLKLDILGHDVPTIIRNLEALTGASVLDIPLDDPATMKLFTSIDSLKIQDPSYPLDIGSLGIPEFGTTFVRQMLKDTQPKTFSDLVRISGLSHGTDVWLNNAQELVRNNVVTIKEVIATRDDIMNYLIGKNLEPLTAFKIMERVRKGKGLTEEDLTVMKANGVPDWYIKSCNTIQYMFPKAHAVAYVMMSMRIAYFKVHYPLAFYATYFTTCVEDFDATAVCKGAAVVNAKIKAFEVLENPSKKEEDLNACLEVVREYYARGFDFHSVSLEHSEADRFIIKDGKLLPPFLALQGIGKNAAEHIVASRNGEASFLSVEDFQFKTKVSKTVIEAMTLHGCFADLPETNQLSLFSLGGL